MVRQQAQPYIDQYGPKYKMDSIEFESLTLGTLPPTFVGKRTFSPVFVPRLSLPSLSSFLYSGSAAGGAILLIVGSSFPFQG